MHRGIERSERRRRAGGRIDSQRCWRRGMARVLAAEHEQRRAVREDHLARHRGRQRPRRNRDVDRLRRRRNRGRRECRHRRSARGRRLGHGVAAAACGHGEGQDDHESGGSQGLHAFKRDRTRCSRSYPSTVTVAVASVKYLPPTAGSSSQRATRIRSSWPWPNSATGPPAALARSITRSARAPAAPSDSPLRPRCAERAHNKDNLLISRWNLKKPSSTMTISSPETSIQMLTL